MKRIVPLILAVMLIVVMAVPVMAEEYNITDFPSIDSLSVNMEQYPFYTIQKMTDKYELRFYSVVPYGSPQANGFQLKANECWHLRYDFYEGMWHFVLDNSLGEDQMITIVADATLFMSNFDVLTKDGNHVVFTPTPPLTECDGSSCPANDMNVDGVCDDCGLTLSLRLTGYPTLPVVEGDNQHYVITKDASGYSYYVFYSSTSYNVEGEAGEQLTVHFNPGVQVKIFRCTDMKNWVETVSTSGWQYGLGMVDEVDIMKSSITFYDESGNLFFPVPLWMEMVKTTQGEMVEMLAETLATMRILVLCGVGCLALLIGLALFGKRSLIYRG